MEERDSAAEILADEWAFLVSQSWMAAKSHYALNKFRDAGAVIVEFGRRLRDEMISAVVPDQRVPAVLTAPFLTRVAVKWLVVGATGGAGWILPPVAIAAPFEIPLLRAFDP